MISVQPSSRVFGRSRNDSNEWISASTQWMRALKQVDRRFDAMDERFDTMDQRFDAMDGRFEKVDGRFSHVDDEFARLHQEMKDMRAEIKAEGEMTRRHFNVMVERVEAAVRIVAEVNAHQGTVLGNHEMRLQAIEKRG